MERAHTTKGTPTTTLHEVHAGAAATSLPNIPHPSPPAPVQYMTVSTRSTRTPPSRVTPPSACSSRMLPPRRMIRPLLPLLLSLPSPRASPVSGFAQTPRSHRYTLR